MSQTLVTVDFHGQSLVAVLIDGKPHVAMKPICENIGLQWEAQQKRIQRNPVLNKGMSMMDIPSNGGIQETLCLPLSKLNGWLFGVDVNRVREEIKPRLMQYQEECFDVLFRHFMPQQAATQATPAPVSRLALTGAAQLGAEVQAEALARLAGDEWLEGGRWLLSFVRDEYRPGEYRPHVERVEAGTFITTWRRLAENISDPAMMLGADDLGLLARACLGELERRAAYARQLEIAAHRARTAASAKPGPLLQPPQQQRLA